MSYRLKRKRFNCETCTREWNQLVGQDEESVICKDIMPFNDRDRVGYLYQRSHDFPIVLSLGDNCSKSCSVINHDVPAGSPSPVKKKTDLSAAAQAAAE